MGCSIIRRLVTGRDLDASATFRIVVFLHKSFDPILAASSTSCYFQGLSTHNQRSTDTQTMIHNKSTPRLILQATALVSATTFGEIVTLNTSDGFGSSSLTSPRNWSNNQSPGPGNDYFTGNNILRTPTGEISLSFAGDSLTINNNSAYPNGLLYKGSGADGQITFGNLILDGGLVSTASGSNDIFNLYGNISVENDSTLYPKQGPIRIYASISGTSQITILPSDFPASNKVWIHSSTNTFTGNILNNGRLETAENSKLTFAIGASGIANSISDNGAQQHTMFGGTFTFDLTNATSNPGDSWAIVNTTPASTFYFDTFAINGWTEVFDREWWDPTNTYRFTEEDGILAVTTPWNTDSDSDGLPDRWEDEQFGNNDRTATIAELALQAGTDDGFPIADGDGLNNIQEYEADTDPNKADSDEDGLNDGPEVLATLNDNSTPSGFSPTDPNVADSDGDSFTDGFEVASANTDPNSDTSTPIQTAGFTLVEDFEGPGMTIGQTYQNINGWRSPDSPGTMLVADEPIAGGDQVGSFLRTTGAGRAKIYRVLANDGLQIRNGNTGTLFFQAYTSAAAIDHSFGLTYLDALPDFPDFEAQLAMIPSGAMGVRNGPNFGVYNGGGYQVEEWMNIWIVTDNSADIVDVYVQSPNGETGQIQIVTSFGFRNGTAGDALSKFLLIENIGSDPTVYIDNLYVDPTARNLSTPADAKPLRSATYSAWSLGNAGGQTPELDFDLDGVPNGVEYFMNSPAGNTQNPTIVNGSVSWPNGGRIPASEYGNQFVVQVSTDLDNWNDVPVEDITTNTDDPIGILEYSPPVGLPRTFIRLKVTPN